jgi:hypothetical protein
MSDRSVALTLMELADMARARGMYHPSSAAEAEGLLAGVMSLDIADLLRKTLASEAESARACRQLLRVMTEEDSTRSFAHQVLSDPPRDEQLGAELALASAVLLSGLVIWLQLKIHVNIRRQDGVTSFDLEITKDAVEKDATRSLVSVIGRILGGGSP